METIREFTYLGDRVASRKCEAAVNDRTRLWLPRFRESGKLQLGKMLPIKIKKAVY